LKVYGDLPQSAEVVYEGILNKDVRNRRIAEVKSLLNANNVNYNPK
jgi:hypothetical protein